MNVIKWYERRPNMNSEIISVGTEILLGDVVNTNAVYLSKQLALLGINCYFHTVVGDNPKRLKEIANQAISRSDVIIVTGGLGPTYDDLTKEVLAEVLDERLVFDDEAYGWLLDRFKASNRDMTDNNVKQVYRFENGKALINQKGTAPGIFIEKNQKTVILLPGPPVELEYMFEMYIVPHFKKQAENILVSKHIYLSGIGESNVEAILKEEMESYTNPTIAPYSDSDGIYLRITASGETKEACEMLISPVVDHVYQLLGEYVYSIDIPKIEDAVGHLIQEKGLRVYTLENRTRGILNHRLGDHITKATVYNDETLDVDDLKYAIETLYKASDTLVVGFFAHKTVGQYEIVIRYDNQTIRETIQYDRGYQNDLDRILRRASSFLLKQLFDIIS